jgi:hypothetical protein
MSEPHSPELARAEAVECLFEAATWFIPPNWKMRPAVLDVIGELDAALEKYRRTGDASLIEVPFRACWLLGMRAVAP